MSEEKLNKAIEFLAALDASKVIAMAEANGMPELTPLEKLIETRYLLYKKRQSMLDEINQELTDIELKIENSCEHEFGDSTFLYDDHDGYSRVTITSTYSHTCKVCGKTETFDRKSR